MESSDQEIKTLFNILNEEEQTKAKRFVLAQHQRRFIVARTTLKIILSNYLKIAPNQIKFEYSSRGKPTLIKDINPNKLEFNVSHSEELALYGITRDRLIGVDVEYNSPIPDAEQLAKRFFCPQEYEIIRPLTSPEKEQTFFQLWTAKEAYLKATGEGISGGLDQIFVSLKTKPKFLALPHSGKPLTDWTLFTLTPQTGYLASVVVQGNHCALKYWELNQSVF
ncbi:4-phosphopantetheinyl transferase [Aphanothece sacrum FPU1]|uniref:4-phosphopantetheinyl transferase n=1 Tax=Aphanothece sacrum FPU1 TaxID=1920663 RepID=A0A401IJK8_APHSA|nr:4-phosphopantetheinyl transferase [Aphanothece sacrum FPU1]